MDIQSKIFILMLVYLKNTAKILLKYYHIKRVGLDIKDVTSTCLVVISLLAQLVKWQTFMVF